MLRIEKGPFPLKEDVLKLVVRLTQAITNEINDSATIAELMKEFERRGLEAGVEIHPFVRTISPESGSPAPTHNAQEAAASSGEPGFSASDLSFLKALRILPPKSGYNSPSEGSDRDAVAGDPNG